MADPTPSAPIRLLIVDDHAVVCAGFSSILRRREGLEVVGSVQSETEDWTTENRGLAETDSPGRGTGEQPLALEAGDPLQRSLRLGLCEPCEKRQTAVLAEFNLPRLHQARGRGDRAQEADRLASFRHTFGTILNANGGKSQGHSGTSCVTRISESRWTPAFRL